MESNFHAPDLHGVNDVVRRAEDDLGMGGVVDVAVRGG